MSELLFLFKYLFLYFQLHEDGEVVRVSQTMSIVVKTFEGFVVEDVVNTYSLLLAAAEGVHPSVTALFETIHKLAEHGVVHIGIGNVIEVAADNSWCLGIPDFLGDSLCLC